MSRTVAAAETESLRPLYSFRRSDEVAAFLKDHPFLVTLLLEARVQITKYFGSEADVALEVITDPGSVSDRQLFALVRTNLSPDEALIELERLDQEWWLAAMDNAQGHLGIDVEFV